MTARRDAGLVRQVLTYAAAQYSDAAQPISELALGRIGERGFRQLREAGLLPLLYRAIQDSGESIPAAVQDVLKGADLTARVRYGNLCDAANELIDVCASLGVQLTLLKGISIADQHYPAGHLRAMGDIDVLVRAHELEPLESNLISRGYVRKPDYEVDENSPHGAPLMDPRRNVWIEPHTALFPENAVLRRNAIFSPASISAQSVASRFHGRQVYRFSNELQLVYIASYWIRDLSRNAFHPSFVMPLLDAIYIFKIAGSTLDWDGLIARVDNQLAMASLYILVDYLSRAGLVHCAPAIVSRLAARQSIVGPPERKIIETMLDVYLLGEMPESPSFVERHPMVARSLLRTLLAERSHATKVLSLPWNIVFPPWIPGRYGMRYQRERVARLFQRRG